MAAIKAVAVRVVVIAQVADVLAAVEIALAAAVLEVLAAPEVVIKAEAALVEAVLVVDHPAADKVPAAVVPVREAEGGNTYLDP